VQQPARLAVGSVGADQDRRAQSLGAGGGYDVELDVAFELAQRSDGIDLAQLCTGRKRLLQAELVESFAHGHGTDRIAGADPNLGGLVGYRVRVCGALQHDFVADALDHRLNRVAERRQRLARQPAGAGLRPGERAAVKQEHALAGSRQIVSSGAASRAGPSNQDVVVFRHSTSSLPGRAADPFKR
jgi:hypothetical protein